MKGRILEILREVPETNSEISSIMNGVGEDMASVEDELGCIEYNITSLFRKSQIVRLYVPLQCVESPDERDC